jgi:AraC family transcriptional regulator, transcriptional activator of pobA
MVNLLANEVMMTTVRIETIHDYNALVAHETLHPLVSVIDLNKAPRRKGAPAATAVSFGFYAVFLKEDTHCIMKYGRSSYDYQQGTLVFIAPGQVVGIEEDGEGYQPSGHVLLFHPDLIRGTSLGQNINNYNFFSYDVHEALHISKHEKQIVIDSFSKIEYELSQGVDKHSKSLIVANIELFLGYCTRFYDRQFISRDYANRGTLERFEKLLNEYFQSPKLQLEGMPSVSYCAAELSLSPNYFSDLVKKETGKTAQDYIHARVMEVAKEKVFDHSKSISEISYDLGFKYPQHFTRFFKMHAGVSPNGYRNLN